jgi:hypothetical protein
MDESSKYKMLYGLIRRLAIIKNNDGVSEKATVLSISSATVKTLYYIS